MNVYFDASVLVALFSLDPFSSQASRALRGRKMSPVISDFAAAEMASAIARKVRTQLLTEILARNVFSNFDAWSARMGTRIETTPADVRIAEMAIRRLDLVLRAPDALNIAIAQRIGADLATFDRRMADCARALGVPVVVL